MYVSINYIPITFFNILRSFIAFKKICKFELVFLSRIPISIDVPDVAVPA
jgi:hypothetical protein